jgi:energy-coupling factor transporter ATP-binding protein EcfA2
MRLEDLIGPGKTVNIQTLNLIVSPEEEISKPDTQQPVVAVPDCDKKPILNPGIEYGNDGKAKWSPPLQQQLSTMKDAVGVETDDVTVKPTVQDEIDAEEESTGTDLERLKKLAAVFSPHSFPAG